MFNDLGIMNSTFYKYLLSNLDGFATGVQEVLDEAFSDYDVNSTTAWFFEPYIKYLRKRKASLNVKLGKVTEKEKESISEKINDCDNVIRYLQKSILECETEYEGAPDDEE